MTTIQLRRYLALSKRLTTLIQTAFNRQCWSVNLASGLDRRQKGKIKLEARSDNTSLMKEHVETIRRHPRG